MVTRTRVKEKQSAGVPVQDKTQVKECAHHWLIEISNGPTGRGVCKYCGAQKEFLNSIPDISSIVRRDKHPLSLPQMGKVVEDEVSKS